MTDIPKFPCPPYATFSPFINFFNKLRDSQIPARIDPTVFGKASGSLSYSIIAALKSLKLIAQDGSPTAEFVALVKASDEERGPLLREAMKHAYPTLYGGQFPIKAASAGQFDEHIRENYEAKGSTVDKVASFFIAAANYAQIEISDLIKARKPSYSSASSGKSKRQRKTGDEAPQNSNGVSQRQQVEITDKALEYKLVDLMREDGIEADQRDAIWTLLQYLTAKAKAAGQ
jgi:hypothetical protein